MVREGAELFEVGASKGCRTARGMTHVGVSQHVARLLLLLLLLRW